MKWYETTEQSGEKFWWTQRNKNGDCFEIRYLFIGHKFRLLINESKYKDYSTLVEAQENAEMLNNGRE